MRAGGLLTFGQMKAVRRAFLRCSNGFFVAFSTFLAILAILWNMGQNKGWGYTWGYKVGLHFSKSGVTKSRFRGVLGGYAGYR